MYTRQKFGVPNEGCGGFHRPTKSRPKAILTLINVLLRPTWSA
jgi:hypothetical protein